MYYSRHRFTNANFIARELRAPRYYYVFLLHWKGSNRVCANHYRTSFFARSISLGKISMCYIIAIINRLL